MSTIQYEVRAGAYYDSVVLMQLQRSLLEVAGVIDAGVVMATPANREILEANNLLPNGVEAKADDLLIVVKGENDTAAKEAIAQVDALMKQRRASGGSGDFRPKSLASAAKLLPAADWVLISVPGRFAADVADDALELGKHVFLYSDNVSLESEVKLKQKAREKGLLVMGPDCGTAIVHGIGLGFANRVRRGAIGVVGASGTGIQAITAEVHNLGGGISHAIGTGGRDLKDEVGGITLEQGLRALADDEETSVIVLVSKPPSKDIATRLLRLAQSIDKPIVVDFIGYPSPGRQIGNLYFASSLSDAAETAVDLLDSTPAASRETPAANLGFLRGLFSGGTLAYETLLGLQTTLSPLYANIPIRAEQKLADVWQSKGHTILDLGEDEFTQGRLHPMMDNDLRLRRLRQEAADPNTGVILLDVVLGEGAHPDPASEIVPVIQDVQRDGLHFVAMVIGTDEDSQEIGQQIERLEEVGVRVFRTAAATVDYISSLYQQWVESEFAAVDLGESLSAINVGVETFYDSLKAQGAEAVQVEWRPPRRGQRKANGDFGENEEGG